MYIDTELYPCVTQADKINSHAFIHLFRQIENLCSEQLKNSIINIALL